MSLLPKRRSQSESRRQVGNGNGAASNAYQVKHHFGNIRSIPQDIKFSRMEISMGGGSGGSGSMGKRRTSAEMISEAKTFLSDVGEGGGGGGGGGSGFGIGLSGVSMNSLNHLPHQTPASVVGGVRLVSTRRPVTPREPGRVLYGKVALAGRPPSAFSLRYLRNVDQPRTPNLEPIHTSEEEEGGGGGGGGGGDAAPPAAVGTVNTKFQQLKNQSVAGVLSSGDKLSQRSQSFESRFNNYKNSSKNNKNNKGNHSLQLPAKGGNNLMPRKLPALEVKANSVNEKALENLRNIECAERAKTAYSEAHGVGGGVKLIGEKCDDNRAITLLRTRKILTRCNDVLGQSSTEKLIEMLKEHAGLKDCTDETVNHINSILSELYNRVRKNEKHFKKGFILGGLYGLVECTSPKILLSVARVVLALRVSGSNLTGACKLIFKVARNEQNDHLFHETDLLELLIDGLGRASPLEDPEACIYGYGSIRFLTCSTSQERAELTALKDINRNWSAEHLELPRKPSTAPNLGEYNKNASSCGDKNHMDYVQKLTRQDALVLRLSRHGAVQLMILHLQMLNETGATKKLSGPPLHSLYQLSAALRALADVRQTTTSLEQLDNSSCQNMKNNTSIQLELACPHLIKAAEVTLGELEVQANIVRTLSVLSEDADCCHILEKFSARIGMLLGPCCADYNQNTAEKFLSLISRLGYVLGNIMAKYDQARIQFFHNDVAMEYMLTVLENYSKEPLTMHNSLGDSVVDVLIKMIRVVANMSVNSEVGYGLGNTRSLGKILVDTLKSTQQLKSIKLKQELHELCHATLGALHNLCFYQDQIITTPALVQEPKGSLQSILPELATQLCSVLKSTNDEVTQIESARVLGNLTRNAKARKYFCKAKGLKVLVRILNNAATNKIYDLKACTIGILVNLLGDMENRMPLIKLNGSEVLLNLLKDSLQQHEDWFLGTIVCQAFWNLFIDTPHLEDFCGDALLDDLSDLLAEYLDEEKIMKDSQAAKQHPMWEDFALVAADLLERLQSNYDQHSSDGVFSLEGSDLENDEDDVYIERL